jgi:transcriptional regulator with XRE-family HTH domain
MIGERIKRARLAKKLTQQEVADGISVSLTTVSNWELGRKPPSTDNLAKLADFLSVDQSYLSPFGDGSLNNFVQSALFNDLMRESLNDSFQFLVAGNWIEVKKAGLTLDMLTDIVLHSIKKNVGLTPEAFVGKG